MTVFPTPRPCAACGGTSALRVDFGPQPLCNRFLARPIADEPRFPMRLAQCERCGLLQLADIVPTNELAPRFDWISYREPEAHLDGLAARLLETGRLEATARVLGMSFKDDSMLERLARRGLNVRRLDPAADLELPPGAGIETLQGRVRATRVAAWQRSYGCPSLVVARHVLEHAHDLGAFLAALRAVVEPDGRIFFETPDAARSLDSFDYTAMWEEHTLYFTEPTLRSSLAAHGLRVVWCESVHHPTENSLVVLAEVAPPERSAAPPAGELVRAKRFAERFPEKSDRLRALFAEHRRTGGHIAIYGAGHLSSSFVTLHGLEAMVDCFIDDHPKKMGLLMPGSQRPICGSPALLERRITWCLLGLSPESEDKVVERQRAYLAGGGRFSSILPGSRYALEVA